MLSKEDIEILKKPFDDKTVGVKIQSFNKAKDKALLILYLQHTDVQDRLDAVDPAWSNGVTDEARHGETFVVRMKLTVKGTTRENVGEGETPKAAHSDALKRCAMLFGVGRYLYDSEHKWVPYNEQTDKFRVWTIQDFHGKPVSSIKPPKGESAEMRKVFEEQDFSGGDLFAEGSGLIRPPKCCGRPMMVDRYDAGLWYCVTCKKKEARAA